MSTKLNTLNLKKHQATVAIRNRLKPPRIVSNFKTMKCHKIIRNENVANKAMAAASRLLYILFYIN